MNYNAIYNIPFSRQELVDNCEMPCGDFWFFRQDGLAVAVDSCRMHKDELLAKASLIESRKGFLCWASCRRGKKFVEDNKMAFNLGFRKLFFEVHA